MRRPDRERRMLRRLRECCALLCVPLCAVGQPPGAEPETAALADRSDWYRVEVLVFARDGDDAFAAEQWDPLPALQYPQEYRFLVDPALADARAQVPGIYRSSFDDQGVQRLLLPRPPHGIEILWRPDARLEPPAIEFLPEPDPVMDPLPGAVPGRETDPPAAVAVPADAPLSAADGSAQEPPPEAPLLALLHTLLPTGELEFRAQARQLRRQGNAVLFHGAWWTTLSDDSKAITVVLDRAADSPATDWPALQGSLRLYRSRYLHAQVDLWLNTDGRYLPAAWRIPAPPRPLPSLRSELLDGSVPDPLAPLPTLEELLTPAPRDLPSPALDTRAFPLPPGTGPYREARDNAETAGASSAPATGELPAGSARGTAAGEVSAAAADAGEGGLAGPEAGTSEEAAEPWPYRHAIVSRQSARMRGGEIHYLDHPVLGVVLRLTPAGEENPPARPLEEMSWRERHGFPTDRLPLPEDADALED